MMATLAVGMQAAVGSTEGKALALGWMVVEYVAAMVGVVDAAKETAVWPLAQKALVGSLPICARRGVKKAAIAVDH